MLSIALLKNIFTYHTLAFGAGTLLFKFSSKVISIQNIGKFLTVFLLFSLGLKGGGGLFLLLDQMSLMIILALVALLIGFVLPFLSFFLLRVTTKLSQETISAISASYGSVSVMTFVAATSFLESRDIEYAKAMIGICALMELPALFSGVYLATRKGQRLRGEDHPIKHVWHHCIKDRSMQALLAGIVCGAIAKLFYLTKYTDAILVFWPICVFLFLLLLGMKVASHFSNKMKLPFSVLTFGFYMPLIGASIGLLLCWILPLSLGNGILLTTLFASASYIAAPAVMSSAVKNAEENIYLPLALAITFPFNVTVGIPLYHYLVSMIYAG